MFYFLLCSLLAVSALRASPIDPVDNSVASQDIIDYAAFNGALSSALHETMKLGMKSIYDDKVTHNLFAGTVERSVLGTLQTFVNENPMNISFWTKEVFKNFDSNGDGRLASDELHCEFVKKNGEAMDLASYLAAFENPSVVRPGAELCICIAHKLHRKYFKREGNLFLSDLFNVIDTNDDNVINTQDILDLSVTNYQAFPLHDLLKKILSHENVIEIVAENVEQWESLLPPITKELLLATGIAAKNLFESTINQRYDSFAGVVVDGIFRVLDYENDGFIDKTDVLDWYNFILDNKDNKHPEARHMLEYASESVLRNDLAAEINKVLIGKSFFLGGQEGFSMSDFALFKDRIDAIFEIEIDKPIDNSADLEHYFNELGLGSAIDYPTFHRKAMEEIISVQEPSEWISEFFQENPLDLPSVTRGLFNILDVNQDERLEFHELRCLAEDKAVPGNFIKSVFSRLFLRYANRQASILEDLFKALDTDGDKVVSTEELLDVSMRFYKHSAELAKKMLQFGGYADKFVMEFIEDIPSVSKDMAVSMIAPFKDELNAIVTAQFDLYFGAIVNAIFETFDWNFDDQISKSDVLDWYNFIIDNKDNKHSEARKTWDLLLESSAKALISNSSDSMFDAKRTFLGGIIGLEKSELLELEVFLPLRKQVESFFAQEEPMDVSSSDELQSNFLKMANSVNSLAVSVWIPSKDIDSSTVH